ncbi:MAG: TonB family protein [Bacteroidales bacterium]|nr:TonB family protein [Bacteroidales bacterium]
MKYLQSLPILISTIFITVSMATMGQNFKKAEVAGGKAGFKEFLEYEMQYPAEAIKNKSEGKLRISFDVLPDGELTAIHITGSSDSSLIKEARRLLKRTVWIPGESRGTQIRTSNTTQIEFKIKKYHRYVKRRGYDSIPCYCSSCDSSASIYKGRQLSKTATPVFDKDQDFTSFIKKNLQYPETAKKMNLNGQVSLKFVIESSSIISNIIVTEHLGMGCTEEAIRVIQLLKWSPAEKDKTCVRSWNTVSLFFGNPKGGFKYMPMNQFNSLN